MPQVNEFSWFNLSFIFLLLIFSVVISVCFLSSAFAKESKLHFQLAYFSLLI